MLLGLDALQVEPAGHPHVPAPPRVLAERPPVRLGRRDGLSAAAAAALRAHPGPPRRAVLVQRAAQARREPRAAARDDLLQAAPLVRHCRRRRCRRRRAPLQQARGDPLRQRLPHPRLRRALRELRARRGAGAVIPPVVRSGATAAAADWWEGPQLPRRLLDCIARLDRRRRPLLRRRGERRRRRLPHHRLLPDVR